MSVSHSVWKFEIPIADKFTVEMPTLAKIIHVGVQRGVPCMWAHVNPANRRVERAFYVRGTGHPLEPGLEHLGSFMLHGDEFVGHLFEWAGARLVDA